MISLQDLINEYIEEHPDKDPHRDEDIPHFKEWIEKRNKANEEKRIRKALIVKRIIEKLQIRLQKFHDMKCDVCSHAIPLDSGGFSCEFAIHPANIYRCQYYLDGTEKDGDD